MEKNIKALKQLNNKELNILYIFKTYIIELVDQQRALFDAVDADDHRTGQGKEPEKASSSNNQPYYIRQQHH